MNSDLTFITNEKTKHSFYRYIDAGKLKAYKIGKEFRIEKSEFERFMNKAKAK